MAKVKAEGQELAELDVDEELMKQMMDEAGEGLGEADASDFLVPLVYVLQPMSPQVLPGPAQLDGAKAGDIWLKNSPDPIINGKEGIWFQPCHYYRKWNEWVPRDQGGGFRGSYDWHGPKNPPQGALIVEDEDGRRGFPRYRFENGNSCVDTRYIVGLAWRNGTPTAHVIPFSSTGHKPARDWLTAIQNLRTPNGRPFPSYAFLYKVTTHAQTNPRGTWYMLDISPPVKFMPVKTALSMSTEGRKVVGNDYHLALDIGRQLKESFKSGEKRAAEEEQVTEEKVDMKDEIPY